jgi:hypothetical protein
MHSAVTGVRVLVTRTPEHAHWLAHFCWGLHIVAAEKGKATEMSYSDVRSSVNFCRGFILWQQGTCFYVWLLIQKRERTPIYAPSYKSDSLVFRCSFYYLSNTIRRSAVHKNHNSILSNYRVIALCYFSVAFFCPDHNLKTNNYFAIHFNFIQWSSTLRGSAVHKNHNSILTY